MGFLKRFLPLVEKQEQMLWLLACVALLAKVCSKVMDVAGGLGWDVFGFNALTFQLIVVFCLYFALYILARRLSRALLLPASFIFLIFPFFIYFIFLLNSLTFHLSDSLFLWISMALILVASFLFKPSIEEKENGSIHQTETFAIWILIFFIVLYGLMLFLSANFKFDRAPFADENTFWFVAAKEMLEKGVLIAHQGGYPGGGLHPFGVPFLNAFPGLLLNISSHHLIFFMPIYILVGFSIFLFEFMSSQRAKWGMIFFLTAWFAAFNNRSWAGGLFYSIVYGESVCMVLVLSILSWFALSRTRMTSASCFVASFLFGLLSLTKFPFILLSPVFFIIFLLLNRERIKGVGRKAFMIALFVLPFIVLKLFQSEYGGHISSLSHFGFDRLFEPNIDMLSRVVQNIVSDAGNLFYYSIFSIVVTLIFFRKLWYGCPVLIWILFLGFYYGYIYCYGVIGAGDAASGLRYYLPAGAGLLLLGSLGIEKIAEKFRLVKNKLFQSSLFLILIYLLFLKLF